MSRLEMGEVLVPCAPRLTWRWWRGLLLRGAATGAGSGMRLLNGDAGAVGAPEPRPTFGELYHAQRLRMVHLAVMLVDDLSTAEDVVQDAFAALYRRHGEELGDVDHALAYLRTAVVNTARSVLRRRRHARAYVPPHEVAAPAPDDRLILDEEHREVFAALRKLTKRQREVLVLKYWSECTEAQIAETLGISRGAVKSIGSRALDALEKVLEAPG